MPNNTYNRAHITIDKSTGTTIPAPSTSNGVYTGTFVVTLNQ